MNSLYEATDTLDNPYEGFLMDSETMGFPIRPHWHYFMEIIYMLEGSALINCDNKTYTVAPNEMILFHPQSVHSIFKAEEKPLKYYVLKFDINRLNITSNYAPKFRTIFHNAYGLESAPIHFTHSTLIHTSVSHNISCYVEELKNKQYGYDMLVNSELCALLTTMIRIWKKMGFDVEKSLPLNADVITISMITEYIDKHSDSPIKVGEIAKLCNMSYSHFAKSFREIYGQSCKDFIEYIRICKVEDFLLFTEYDLNYISQETGFSDCSHLIKTFKRLRGITPKQFKLQRKNENRL